MMRFDRNGVLISDTRPRPAAGRAAPAAAQDQRILTLPQAATMLGISPERASDLLASHSVPRVVGWPRRDIEELARVVQEGT